MILIVTMFIFGWAILPKYTTTLIFAISDKVIRMALFFIYLFDQFEYLYELYEQ